ncbi:sulfotransferase [Crenalkalicoccus roseus]|uniref:sulfotransferase n=1 Tax=Crenalkalicoccus roseus TaxID=1485588 RepID=UPI001081DC99|nr:sulfotransferase [Crenalkalicoccus roseus]
MTAPAPPGALLCLLATGRSGSTLLQRLLNLHDSVVMFGEHNGLAGTLLGLWHQLFGPWAGERIARAARFVPEMLASRPIAAPEGWSIEWANACTEATALPAFRRFLEDLLFPPALRRPGMRYWGFKEIRYGPAEAAFLARLFPEGRFLVLLRDPVAIQRSRAATGAWYPGLDAAQAAAAMHREFQALCDAWEVLRALPGGRARLVSCEALTEAPRRVLEGIAAWAGLPPFDPERVAAVMGAPHRPGGGDPHRVAAFLDAYRAGPAEADRARWRAALAEAAGG